MNSDETSGTSDQNYLEVLFIKKKNDVETADTFCCDTAREERETSSSKDRDKA